MPTGRPHVPGFVGRSRKVAVDTHADWLAALVSTSSQQRQCASCILRGTETVNWLWLVIFVFFRLMEKSMCRCQTVASHLQRRRQPLQQRGCDRLLVFCESNHTKMVQFDTHNIMYISV
jgi:hypothetical protein